VGGGQDRPCPLAALGDSPSTGRLVTVANLFEQASRGFQVGVRQVSPTRDSDRGAPNWGGSEAK
jgi:hypothetical protein